MSTDDEDEDEESPLFMGFTVDEALDNILFRDDPRKFVDLVKSERPEPFQLRPPEILRACCVWNSVKCASALFNGETGQTVDINEPCSTGLYPFHYAAKSLRPEITELYLYHGAQTHLRSPNNKLPLNEALEGYFTTMPELEPWTPTKHSIYKLLLLLCLPQLQDALETVGLVAWKTKEAEDEILRYAREGKIIELAALLLVARKKLTRPLRTFGECISTPLSFEDREALLMAGRNLLEVFERAGEALQEYVQSDKTGLSRDQTIIDVQLLLRRAGFVLEPQVSDFSDMTFLHLHMLVTRRSNANGGSIIDWRFPPRDRDMPHYSTSGYRWPCKVSNELAREMAKPKSYASNARRSFHTLRVLKANSVFNFPRAVDTEMKNTTKGVEHHLPNALGSKPWAVFASVIKRLSIRG